MALPEEAWAAGGTSGTIVGRVEDQDSRQPLDGVTVVAAGPQGEQALLTDGKGQYAFRDLPIGDYVVRFFRGDVAIEEMAKVSIDQTVRVNARIRNATEPAKIIEVVQRAPAIDVGSTRVGATFSSDFATNLPNTLTVSGLLEKTPGALSDPTGLALSGGTGLENSYFLEGLNITALRDGALGTKLFVPFLEEVEVASAGYGAEYGRSMGGVVNMALKSGSNEWHGSASGYLTPGYMSGSPHRVYSNTTSLTGTTELDYTSNLAVELGGPIIKDKLFIWVGYAPEISRNHLVQYADRFVEDTSHPGNIAYNDDGTPVTVPLYQRRYAGEMTTQHYAGKLTWKPRPTQTLSLSLYGIYAQQEYMQGANMDFLAGMTSNRQRINDMLARWTGEFFQGRWRLDATVGLHVEQSDTGTPFQDSDQLRDVHHYENPSLGVFNPDVAALCSTGATSCPVQNYQSGGYGTSRDIDAFRLAAQMKSTNIFHGLGLHELKYGVDSEFVQFRDQRWNSGPDGNRASAEVSPDGITYWSLLTGPKGIPAPVWDPNDPAQVAQASAYASQSYRDVIDARTHQLNLALFLQESYSPIPNLTFNLGVRWETQHLYDREGQHVLSINDNIAPRLGVVFDPSREGRSKVFAHFGRYYESIPMEMSDRAFGGEGVMMSTGPYDPRDPRPGQVPLSSTTPAFIVDGSNMPIPHGLKGAYNDEIVAGGQYEVLRDLVVGVTGIYRRLGRAIEDMVNPDPNGTSPMILGNPEGAKREYKAVQLSAKKRFARRWFFSGAYTLSSLRGNYIGMYNADLDQRSSNMTRQFDLPGIMINRNGPLPNDRPHLIRADGYYTHPFSRSSLTGGLSFVGMSGQPLNAVGGYQSPGDSSTFLAPRGSAGRTPFVTRFDLHLGYRRSLPGNLSAAVFLDIFNIFNERTVLTRDQTYTADKVGPAQEGTKIKGGTVVDANGSPLPVAKNASYLMPTSYQAPISGRLGVAVYF
jgi:outer membrane receptor protein involved in Fe transport